MHPAADIVIEVLPYPGRLVESGVQAQILPAAPAVTELLGACPGLTVLVTSRAPSELSGEHEQAAALHEGVTLQNLNWSCGLNLHLHDC
ncbi:MAG TPA: hypothetical protein VIO16_04825 [Dehalococcoidia bacterium]